LTTLLPVTYRKDAFVPRQQRMASVSQQEEQKCSIFRIGARRKHLAKQREPLTSFLPPFPCNMKENVTKRLEENESTLLVQDQHKFSSY